MATRASAMICGFDPLCFVYRLTGLHACGTGVARVCEHVPASSNLFASLVGRIVCRLSSTRARRRRADRWQPRVAIRHRRLHRLPSLNRICRHIAKRFVHFAHVARLDLHRNDEIRERFFGKLAHVVHVFPTIVGERRPILSEFVLGEMGLHVDPAARTSMVCGTGRRSGNFAARKTIQPCIQHIEKAIFGVENAVEKNWCIAPIQQLYNRQASRHGPASIQHLYSTVELYSSTAALQYTPSTPPLWSSQLHLYVLLVSNLRGRVTFT